MGKLTTTSQRTLLSKRTELGRKEGSRKSWESPCSAKTCSATSPHCGLETEERGWEWVFRQPYGCIQTCLGMALSSFWCCPAPIWIDLHTVGQKVGNSRIFMVFIAEWHAQKESSSELNKAGMVLTLQWEQRPSKSVSHSFIHWFTHESHKYLLNTDNVLGTILRPV